ncbi:hypothetical protein Q3A68_15680 [Mucilaginibacter sp. BT774]|nr:hypothetical protein [Mucilaginibacter sp. BT774]
MRAVQTTVEKRRWCELSEGSQRRKPIGDRWVCYAQAFGETFDL